ncbi:hypothetical protein SRHO_G00263080 [Serrasalmus rhombeus]
MQAKVIDTIHGADCISGISDGWSNIRGQGIINFIVTTLQPVFYKSIDTKDDWHTGTYIGEQLKAVVNDLGPDKDIKKLKTMNTQYKRAKEVVKYVKGKQVLSAIYLSKQLEKKKSTTPKLPSNTQWGGVVIMYESLLEGKESLQQMAICQTASIESDVKRIILDDVFWERLTGSFTILKPIVTKIEGDDATLSDVQYLFADLKQQIQMVLPTSLS